MTRVHNLGFPRIGHKRELKKATEAYWSGEIDGAELEARGAQLRERHWRIQQTCGVDLVPVGDFTFYDQMLDMSCTLGAIPPPLWLLWWPSRSRYLLCHGPWFQDPARYGDDQVV